MNFGAISKNIKPSSRQIIDTYNISLHKRNDITLLNFSNELVYNINLSNLDNIKILYSECNHFSSNFLEKSIGKNEEIKNYFSFFSSDISKPKAWIYNINYDANSFSYCISFKDTINKKFTLLDITSTVIIKNGNVITQSDKINTRLYIAHSYGILGLISNIFPPLHKYFKKKAIASFNYSVFS